MGRTIENAHFEKNERHIYGIYTAHPELAPQYYSLVEPTSFGKVSSGHFTYDGQVFSRKKEHGGNKSAGYVMYGKGKTKSEVIADRGEYAVFKRAILTYSHLTAEPNAGFMFLPKDFRTFINEVV